MDLTDDAIDTPEAANLAEVPPMQTVQSENIVPSSVAVNGVGDTNISTHVVEADRGNDATRQYLEKLREVDVATELNDEERMQRRDVIAAILSKNRRVAFRTVTNPSKTLADEERLVGVAGPSGVNAKRPLEKASQSATEAVKEKKKEKHEILTQKKKC